MKTTIVSTLAVIMVICGLLISLMGSWTRGGLLMTMGIMLGGLDLILSKLDEIKDKLNK